MEEYIEKSKKLKYKIGFIANVIFLSLVVFGVFIYSFGDKSNPKETFSFFLAVAGFSLALSSFLIQYSKDVLEEEIDKKMFKKVAGYFFLSSLLSIFFAACIFGLYWVNKFFEFLKPHVGQWGSAIFSGLIHYSEVFVYFFGLSASVMFSCSFVYLIYYFLEKNKKDRVVVK